MLDEAPLVICDSPAAAPLIQHCFTARAIIVNYLLLSITLQQWKKLGMPKELQHLHTMLVRILRSQGGTSKMAPAAELQILQLKE